MRYIVYGLAIFAALLTVAFATGYLPRRRALLCSTPFASVVNDEIAVAVS